MVKPRRVASRKKDKHGFTLAFYSADNWVRMRWIGVKLDELRSKLKDKELAEVADAFYVIERQFDRMYRRVGEEIWVTDENQSYFIPEIGPPAEKIGRKGRVPAKRLEFLKKIPGLKIEVRLPGEEQVQKFMPLNKEEEASDTDQGNIDECYRLLKEIGELPPMVELLQSDRMVSLVWDDHLNRVKVLTTEKPEEDDEQEPERAQKRDKS